MLLWICGGIFATPPPGLRDVYEQAYQEFTANHYANSLRHLALFDSLARSPSDRAEGFNLRGIIFMRKHDYKQAQVAFAKATEAAPDSWNPRFNLGEISFISKNWGEARRRFETLLTGPNNQLEEETCELVQFKILLTHLLEGNETEAVQTGSELERSSSGPAAYYAHAAIARHLKEPDAAEWTTKAKERFPLSLNKLYAESFIEVGWEKRPAEEARARFVIGPQNEGANRNGTEVLSTLEEAKSALENGDPNSALRCLDKMGLCSSSVTDAFLLGSILLELKQFDRAETALQQAVVLNPNSYEAKYALAQVAFRKKDYRRARDQMEALYAEIPIDEPRENLQVVKFQIFLALLLEEKEKEAQVVMEHFNFTSETPALYYCQAALAFKHGEVDQGKSWVASAQKIYSSALNGVFMKTLVDLNLLATRPITVSQVSEE